MSWMPKIFPHAAEQMSQERLLDYVLGERLVALALGRSDVQAVRESLQMETGWTEVETAKLALLYRACMLIAQIHADVEIIQRWLLSPHPLLKNNSVIQEIRRGVAPAVLIDAVQQYVWGTVKMRLVKF